MIEVKEPLNTCCICNKIFEGRGNNPSPVFKKRVYKGYKAVCCDHCNLYKVLPARILLLNKSKEELDGQGE